MRECGRRKEEEEGEDREEKREGGEEATQLENEKPKYAAFSLGN